VRSVNLLTALTVFAPFGEDLSMRSVQRSREGRPKRPKGDDSIRGPGSSVCS
jgi:hypothetical protein